MINFYIVATPIGNYDDISIRALNILKEADFIVCEEEREYKRLFSRLGIKEKKYILCNEHTEKEAIELVLPLLNNGEKGALISDCGTPLFEDPGFNLIAQIRANGFKITSLPGANSLITMLSLAPFKVKDFYYAGFLPKNNQERVQKLYKILKKDEAIIIIETPYRLKSILELFKKHIHNRRIFIAYNLTMEDEELIWGDPAFVLKKIINIGIEKGEFLILIEPKKLKK